MQSLGEIELRAPAVGAKIGVFVCHAWSACAWGTYSSNKYCVTVYGSILMPFSAIFQKGLLCQVHYMVLIYVARWCHNFREIAVKNCENPKKMGGKFCAHHFV